MRNTGPYRLRGGRAAHWAVLALLVTFWGARPPAERPPVSASVAPLAPAARLVDVEAGVVFLQHPHALAVDGLLGVFQAGARRYVVTGAGIVQVGDAVGPYTVRGIREDAILLEDADSVFVLELESGACIAHSARLDQRTRW